MIHAELETAGQLIGNDDVLVAAHARALDLALVTGNMCEFVLARGLEVETWR